jgi:hypothetical protein
MTGSRRPVLFWVAIGAAGFLLVPWYALQDSVFALSWIPTPRRRTPAPLRRSSARPVVARPPGAS